ncbi:MAG: alpha/beta fold hydrolase, partial [Ignavibacteriae bacterium]|nr:alpha/beta fold hydrolase [Ignavibacteriota bacterium]
PTVIMVHGFGDRKETLEGFASGQATYGYVVYTYSVRGQGNSGGLSNLISTTEAQDLIEFVNFIRTDFQTGLDTSKILIMGGSQGGTVPYIAACMGGLKVKTIISALTSPEFASSWIENGSVKMTFLWTINYVSDTARYSPQVLAMRNWVYSSAPDKWDSLAYWVPKERNFTNIVSHNTIPIMMENAWQDKFFNAKGNIDNIPYVTAPKRYYFGAVRGHGGDYSVTEDTWHENFFNEWFYYWLFDIDNGILTRPKYHYAFTTFPETNGMWSFVHDSSSVWPPGTNNLILYFRNNNRLLTTPGTNQTNNLVNNVRAGFTMETAVNEEFKGTAFTNNFKKATLTYNSSVLTQDIKMVGTPQIRLDYSSSTTECQFNFQIYEVSGTKAKLVTRINYTDRKNIANSRKNVIFNGLSHGHIFKAGNTIRIILTNLDTAPGDSSFLGSNPHVLPDLKNGTSKIFYSSNCFINIPVESVGSRPISAFQSNSNQNLNSAIKENNLIPSEYNLNQNYPNPFNPTTTINYSIPQNSFVTLKVYDISGKEVATLVNSVISPGFYSIKFNSVTYGLSSGIYFYKLTAGSYINIKKLVLIK